MSDSNMTVPGGVFGTAGHIDHGKTALIRALTGIDTDRLAEEKRRGISIDLGFAHLKLPSGRTIGFVDVPGHERFIKNMLAGAGGIDAVLLVVAADESVKPQTREHLSICRLLGVRHGIVVLTKSDAATPEQIQQTRFDVAALCRGSFLEGAPVIEASAFTGFGIARLKSQLAALAERLSARPGAGFARLPVDRSFSLKGFGTVVTGTLWSGILRTGDEIQLHPSARKIRIRGLQVHGANVDAACAGQRTAVNLAGIDALEIQRGQVVTHAGNLRSATIADATVEWLDQAEPPAGRESFLFHAGTAEVLSRVKMLAPRIARIWLSQPVLLFPGDRFVLRRPSPAQTVGGGTIIDISPPLRLTRAKAASRAASLAGASAPERIEILVRESTNGRRVSELSSVTGLPEAEIRSAIASNSRLLIAPSAGIVLSNDWRERQRQKLVKWLTGFHAQHPSEKGASVSAARLGLDPALAAIVFDGFSSIRIEGDLISLSTHRAQFSTEELRLLDQIESVFRRAAMEPPSPAAVLSTIRTDPPKARRLIETLVKAGKLVRVNGDLVFHADAIAQLRHSLAGQRGRRFSVPEFKQWTRTSRKYAIPLLEYLDRERVTRRDGDARIVL
jgi:selenocysteine-specific elongation factor